MDALQLFARLLDRRVLESLDLLLLRLRAGCHRGLGAEAVHEHLQMRDLALLVFKLGRLLLLARLFLGQEIIVVAMVVMERARAQLEHAGAERIEESTVVGNHHEAAGITREVFLEPEQGLQIEMVRRLVE